jgi:hypothetical protein
MSPTGRHTVKLHGIVVGYSELEQIDPTLGVARGAFRPGVGYDLVQPIFRLFTEAVPDAGGAVADTEKLARYHKSRDALSLLLEDDAGRPVATSAIHISDYSDRPKGTIELEVLISDRAYWMRRGDSS